MSGSPEVRAAGGVVVRGGSGGPEVAVVHRPKYDDWTLPKGKLTADEGYEEGALREVEEETGLRCELGHEVASSRYVDPKGRDKLVRYWRMHPLEGEFSPNSEVDELRWMTPGDAEDLLSYERDIEVLRSAMAEAD